MKLMNRLTGLRVICIDEFSVNTKMRRLYGRSPRGKPCRVSVPHGHWMTMTVVAALCEDGSISPEILDGTMNGERFGDCLRKPVEKLRPGDIVICDNLSAHKVSGIDEILQKAKASIRYLRSHSPELNPIDQAILKRKAHIRKVAARTRDDLDVPVMEAAKTVTSEAARNYIQNS